MINIRSMPRKQFYVYTCVNNIYIYIYISLCQVPPEIKKEHVAEPADPRDPALPAPTPAQVRGLVAAAESEFRRRDTSQLQAWFVGIGSN